MAITEYNYIPKYIKRTIANKPKDVVTASYWNELFNLLITQGDHTAKELGNILNHFTAAINEVNGIADSKYVKPTDGIPKTDLESAVQTSLDKADSALQSVPSTYRTASEQDTIDSGKVDKVTGKGLSTNDYTDADKAKVDAIEPVTEQTVSGWGFTKNTGTYSKPTGGIPKADLANDVQASLGKADTALQEHQSLAAYRTAAEQNIIDNSKQDKLIAGDNITISADGKTISATGGGSSVPKPLTYDYMPEGYPTKSVQTITLMEEQEVEFVFSNDLGVYWTHIQQSPLAIAEGKTYTVNWDGTEYECVCFVFNSIPAIGNLSIFGVGDDTGEPFAYEPDENAFITLNPSPTHTISVKTTEETVTPMATEFIPTMNVSAFTNDAGYLTLATLPKYEGVVE